MREHRNRPAGNGAAPKSNGRPDTRQDSRGRVWSEAFPTLREHDVLAAIRDADLRTLARALDPGAFGGDHGPNGFRCPTCAGWSAEVCSEVLWRCEPCGHTGTRYELVHRVACDGFAAVQLARLGGVLR